MLRENKGYWSRDNERKTTLLVLLIPKWGYLNDITSRRTIQVLAAGQEGYQKITLTTFRQKVKDARKPIDK